MQEWATEVFYTGQAPESRKREGKPGVEDM